MKYGISMKKLNELINNTVNGTVVASVDESFIDVSKVIKTDTPSANNSSSEQSKTYNISEDCYIYFETFGISSTYDVKVYAYINDVMVYKCFNLKADYTQRQSQLFKVKSGDKFKVAYSGGGYTLTMYGLRKETSNYVPETIEVNTLKNEIKSEIVTSHINPINKDIIDLDKDLARVASRTATALYRNWHYMRILLRNTSSMASAEDVKNDIASNNLNIDLSSYLEIGDEEKKETQEFLIRVKTADQTIGANFYIPLSVLDQYSNTKLSYKYMVADTKYMRLEIENYVITNYYYCAGDGKFYRPETEIYAYY